MIVLAPVAHADRDALLAFEQANQAYFEAQISARAAAYYRLYFERHADQQFAHCLRTSRRVAPFRRMTNPRR